jgi:hypothetical protein
MTSIWTNRNTVETPSYNAISRRSPAYAERYSLDHQKEVG